MSNIDGAGINKFVVSLLESLWKWNLVTPLEISFFALKFSAGKLFAWAEMKRS